MLRQQLNAFYTLSSSLLLRLKALRQSSKVLGHSPESIASSNVGVTTFGPLLVEAGEGHIVNTASEAGLVTNSVLGMYCATKHAVVGLSESLWWELHSQGVGVSCLCPNLVNTRIFQSERNRPYAAELTATQNAIMTPLRETLSARGIAPSQVAAHVVDAITEDRFWVFTHDITPTAAAVRFADIDARRNPTNPYEGIEL